MVKVSLTLLLQVQLQCSPVETDKNLGRNVNAASFLISVAVTSGPQISMADQVAQQCMGLMQGGKSGMLHKSNDCKANGDALLYCRTQGCCCG